MLDLIGPESISRRWHDQKVASESRKLPDGSTRLPAETRWGPGREGGTKRSDGVGKAGQRDQLREGGTKRPDGGRVGKVGKRDQMGQGRRVKETRLGKAGQRDQMGAG